MTDREKAIVMAYTGVCMLKGDKLQIFYEYIENIMGRPIMTHDIGWLENEIKEKAKADFIALCKDDKTRWIPVSERLPETFSYVNCTCHSLIDDREDWVVETVYIPQPSNSPYSEWGNIPILNWKKAEVVAWMYRDIPKPYKTESEVKE